MPLGGVDLMQLPPVWMRQSDNLSSYSPGNVDTPKHLFVVTAKSHNLNTATKLRPMPITTKNKLPHFNFPIGPCPDDGSICTPFDTGAALNSGELKYHCYIKSVCPQFVDSYEEFNGSNSFDPIKLLSVNMDN